jgi:DNA modification methylase
MPEMSDFFQHCIIGDCVESLAVFPNECAHQIITVPPSGDSWSYQGYDVTMGEKSEYDFPRLVKEMYRVLVNGGVLCWNVGESWHTEPDKTKYENNAPARQLLQFKKEGFFCHATIIVDKRVRTDPNYPEGFEYVFCMSKGTPRVFNRQNTSKIWSGPSRIEEDLMYSIDNHHTHVSAMHQSPTRIWLIKDLMLTYTNENDIVIDPFLGSGTTLQVARALKRNAIGIEKNEEYAGLYQMEIDV